MNARLLDRIEIFKRLNQSARVILEEITAVEYQADRTILLQGETETPRKMYVILVGAVDIFWYIESRNADRPIFLARRMPGDLIGELSLIDGLPHVAEVKTIEKSLLLPLNEEQFRALIRADDQFAINVMCHLTRKVRQATRRLERYDGRQATVRVAKAIQEAVEMEQDAGSFPGSAASLTIRMTHEQLAERVRLARPVVTKALAHLRTLGVLSPDAAPKGQIIVISADLLRQAAGAVLE